MKIKFETTPVAAAYMTTTCFSKWKIKLTPRITMGHDNMGFEYPEGEIKNMIKKQLNISIDDNIWKQIWNMKTNLTPFVDQIINDIFFHLREKLYK